MAALMIRAPAGRAAAFGRRTAHTCPSTRKPGSAISSTFNFARVPWRIDERVDRRLSGGRGAPMRPARDVGLPRQIGEGTQKAQNEVTKGTKNPFCVTRLQLLVFWTKFFG